MSDIATLTAQVRKILAETEAEYAQMPFFIRPMIKRGFAKRTGLDFAGWRIRLETVKSPDAALRKSLLALAEHYRVRPSGPRRAWARPPSSSSKSRCARVNARKR